MLSAIRRAVVSVNTRAFSVSASAYANPKVWFDMEIGGEAAGRINMELRADVVRDDVHASSH
jgi:hypothetical protein